MQDNLPPNYFDYNIGNLCNFYPKGSNESCCSISAVYAGVVTTTAQSVANGEAVQFVPPITEINKV